jgi:PAS domain S-box-containing protein
MPHGGCYLWSPGIIALHVVSDTLIVLAYYSIPVTLMYFVRKRTDLSFHWMFVCFAVFILACGTTHLMEIWNIWHADYWLAGGLKALTAVASVPTSILLVKLIPPALALPSPQALQAAYGELEHRVAERTLQLKIINDTLVREAHERQRAEEQLRASSKEIVDLKAALDEHAIVAITDPQGTITYVNDKFCEISKYAREELLGQDHRLINSGHHPDDFISELWRTIAQGRVWHGELKNKAKDGSFYWVDTTIVPFLNERGSPRQYVAIRADITKHKAAESEILHLNAALEERVARRTTELEIANRELEAFSYSISHDLRAPLRAVNGFAEIVLEDFGSQVPEECRSLLERVRDRGRLMGHLIDDLLAFSRLSQQSLSRQPVNVTALVHAVLDELAPQADGRQMDVRVGELPLCLADPALAKQIWVNLLSNAIKYTRGREPALVEIGFIRAEDENVYFVRDNGVGFDMQYANKLFGVFRRLHREDEFEGTGVGLAIVQRIVHRHGGRVWAEAEVDRGATFYFTLEEENAR